MQPLIEYRFRQYRTLRLEVDHSTEMGILVGEFATLRFPFFGSREELIKFAVLELLTNSRRAQAEHGVREPVSLAFSANEGWFRVSIVDSGRGFDLSTLPYDFQAPVESIDMMSEAFMAYREKWHGSRFGMGLLSAKKLFPRFYLGFIDREGRERPWFSGFVRGTRIDMACPLDPRRAGAESSR